MEWNRCYVVRRRLRDYLMTCALLLTGTYTQFRSSMQYLHSPLPGHVMWTDGWHVALPEPRATIPRPEQRCGMLSAFVETRRFPYYHYYFEARL